MACVGCGESVAAGARFCSVCGRAVTFGTVPPPAPPPHALPSFEPGPLYRPREGRVIAGVCAGFAMRYGWDPTIVRLVLGLSLFFAAGTPLLVYLIAWVAMPNGQYALPMEATSGGPGSMRV